MTITPAYWDFTIKKGSTFSYEVQWCVAGTCTPIDLSNMTAALEARATVAASTAFMDLTTENGGIVIADAEAGVMQLYLSATATAALTAVRGVYDLQVNFNSGQDVGYLLQGKMTIEESVTR
jgi:hypothetical protein